MKHFLVYSCVSPFAMMFSFFSYSSFVVQGLPPPEGAGLSQTRFIFCTPFPQVFEHGSTYIEPHLPFRSSELNFDYEIFNILWLSILKTLVLTYIETNHIYRRNWFSPPSLQYSIGIPCHIEWRLSLLCLVSHLSLLNPYHSMPWSFRWSLYHPRFCKELSLLRNSLRICHPIHVRNRIRQMSYGLQNCMCILGLQKYI